VLDWSNPPFAKWFVGGKLNVAFNCVDRHVEAGRGDRVALHVRGEQGEERDVTNADLHRDVQRCANALKERGIGPGDVVGIYLPMIPQVKVAMLARARIGAPHNVVFGGFSPESVKERVEFSEAKALITVDGALRKDEDTGQAITAFVAPAGPTTATRRPRTRSGKIMRRLLCDIAEGGELGDVTTLRDPDVMSQLEGKIKERQDDG
jgi:acyl-coenzyme A synthetase/AMP-(fatty) acid ligase